MAAAGRHDPFDTEERVCDTCWKGVKGKGKGKGDKVKGEGKGKRGKPPGLLEDPVVDASSDEGPSSEETRKGKGGKCEKSKGKGKDGKLEKGKSTVLREQFCNNDEDTSDASTLSSAPTRDPEAEHPRKCVRLVCEQCVRAPPKTSHWTRTAH